MFTRVCLHALRLAYGFFYSLTPLGFKGAVPSFYSSSLPVLSLTATGTTGAADTQLYGDNKNLPLPVPVNKIFVWFHFYQLPFFKAAWSTEHLPTDNNVLYKKKIFCSFLFGTIYRKFIQVPR